jgi:hypothetical protein
MPNIRQQLLDEIEGFCKLNQIENVDKFLNDLVESAFTLKKYGSVPDIFIKKKEEPKPVEEKVEEETEQKVEEKVEVPKPPVYDPENATITIKKTNNEDDYEIYDRI